MLKDNEWINNHREFFSDNEKELINRLNSLANVNTLSNVIDLNNSNSEGKPDRENRLNYIFSEIEKLIDEEKTQLLELKRILLNENLNNNK